MANWGEELERGWNPLPECVPHTRTGVERGGRHPFGLSDSTESATKAQKLDQKVMEHLGAPANWENVGQVYPRSLDFEVVSLLVRLSSAPRVSPRRYIMAGHELLGEGLCQGQTGSSAMPHKMNSRSCERINGFHAILNGHLTMVSQLSGDQWNEGDVSCSVVRRIALPDAFFSWMDCWTPF